VRSLLAVTCFCLVLGACVATPVRHPERLDHYATSVTTSDGWELALFRVPPATAAAGSAVYGTPVVLWHGTGVNRHSFMAEGSDLARYLSERGFDVWIPEYRGDRSSRAPDGATWRSGDWSVDDIAAHDVPAVLAKVRVETRRDQVWWIGHSLGGVLGYITLQGDSRDAIAGIVTLGSPGGWPFSNRVARNSHKLPRARSGQVPIRALARMLRPSIDFSPDGALLHTIINADNVDHRLMLTFAADGTENVGRPMLEQYGRWIRSGQIVSADGSTNYTAGLVGVTAPALVLAGRIDHVSPPWAVRAGYDALGSSDKTYRVFGVGWGTRHDYGHGDLVLGDWAEDEVFAVIADWLEARAR